MSFYFERLHRVPITMDENNLTTRQRIMKFRKIGTKKRHNYRRRKKCDSCKNSGMRNASHFSIATWDAKINGQLPQVARENYFQLRILYSLNY